MTGATGRARWAAAALLAALPALWAWPAWSRESGFAERTVQVGGAERSYVVYTPEHAANPAPVVLVFHGGGGRPQAIMRRSGMSELADQYGFVAVFPEGSANASGRGSTWNIGGAQSVSATDDVGFVRSLLGDLGATVPVDRARVYATGISMGGVFSYRLACEMSDTFAAIAPVSATMVEPACQPHSPVAVLHIHGTDDDRIPIDGGRGDMTASDRSWPAPQQGVTSWSRFDGCTGQPTRSEGGGETCTTYGQCRAAVQYCVVSGGGHAWPEGASERIWAFFAAHPKEAR